MIEQKVKKLAQTQMKKPKSFIVVFIIITLLLLPGIFRLVSHVEPSLEKVLPQDVQEVEVMNTMRSQFAADMSYVVVYAQSPVSDVRNAQFVTYIDMISEQLRTRQFIEEVNSLADLVKEESNGTIPDSTNTITEDIKKNPFVTQYTNNDYSLSVIRIRTDTGASAELITEVINGIRNDIESLEPYNPGSRYEITGFNAIDKKTFEVIMSDFASITLVSMGLVMLVVFLTFRGFAKGMLPMIVVMNALVWTMGITGYLGLTITVVSMVAAAMIMGLGIDFGIHFVHGYFENRKTKSAKESLTEVMQELVRAMVGASFTTIAGFLALLFGVLPAMKTLGIILALGILSTLIGAIFLLPPIIYLYDTTRKTTT